MSKTLSDYSTEVQRVCDTTSTTDVNVIEDEIRRTYQEVLHQAYKWLVGTTVEDVTAVDGQANYSTTTDFMEVYKVYWKLDTSNSYTKLFAISEQDYLNNYINLNDSSPNKYYIKGQTVYVNPAPNQAGTIRIAYIPVVADMTNATDTSVISDRFTKVIVYGAASKFFAFESDPKADAYERYYLNALSDMINELKTQGEILRPGFYNRNRINRGSINYYDGLWSNA